MNKLSKPPCDISLYAILDPARVRGRPLGEMAQQAAIGGATLLQYRDKTSDTRTLIDNARIIKGALHDIDVPVLMNDRIDVALAADLDGVHVGQSDMHPSDARKLLGDNAIIGLTIKNMDHARAAPIDVLDYVCAGGIYTTLSKKNPSNIGLDGWAAIAAHFRKTVPGLPVGGIAGIDETNLADVIANGADGAAIISAIFMADDVAGATRRLSDIIKEVRA